MKAVVKGTTSEGKEFRKKIEKDIGKLYLQANQLTEVDLSPLAQCTEIRYFYLHYNYLAAVDLSPLAKCTKLQRLYLVENRLAAVDLAPLEKCTELQELALQFSTTIRWESPNLDITKLPEGLQKYQEKIERTWEAFTKTERERKQREEAERKRREADSLILQGQDCLAKQALEEARQHFEAALAVFPGFKAAQEGLLQIQQIEEERKRQAEERKRAEEEERKRQAAEQLRNEREETLRNIIKMYNQISLEKMARLLTFEDSFELESWLLAYAGELSFKVEGEQVIIPSELKEGTARAEQKIASLIEQMPSREDRFCFHCGLPLAAGERTCSNCRVRCEVCKMAVCQGEAIALCPFCERTFHYEHLREWIRTNGHCPVCRTKLKEKWYIRAEQTIKVEALTGSEDPSAAYALSTEVIIQVIEEGFATNARKFSKELRGIKEELAQDLEEGFSASLTRDSELKERQLQMLDNQERLLAENKELIRTLLGIDQAIKHNQEVSKESFESLAEMIEGLKDDYLQAILDKLHEDKSLREKVTDKMKDIAEETVKKGAKELLKETAKRTNLLGRLKDWLKGAVKWIKEGNIPVFQIVKLVLTVVLAATGVPIPLGIL